MSFLPFRAPVCTTALLQINKQIPNKLVDTQNGKCCKCTSSSASIDKTTKMDKALPDEIRQDQIRSIRSDL